MTILSDLKQALIDNIEAYNRYCDQRGVPMHPIRAHDVMQLQEIVRSSDLACDLREKIQGYIQQLKCATMYEYWFGWDYCWLKIMVEKTLRQPKFLADAIMMSQLQELARDNVLCRQELAELKTFQSSLGGIDLATLKEKIDHIGHLESCNRAMRCENHFLARQLADKQDEVDRLQKALACKSDVSCHGRQVMGNVATVMRESDVIDGEKVSATFASKVVSVDALVEPGSFFGDASMQFFSSPPRRYAITSQRANHSR